jgi:hypothetical protein
MSERPALTKRIRAPKTDLGVRETALVGDVRGLNLDCSCRHSGGIDQTAATGRDSTSSERCRRQASVTTVSVLRWKTGVPEDG